MEVQDHVGLVKFVTGSFIKDGELIEDSESYSDAMVGLWKALRSFKQNGTAFSTHAVNCMRNEILNGLRQRDEKIEVVPFCEVENKNEDCEFEPMDESRCQAKIIAAEFVENMLKSDDPNIDFVQQYYLEGKTLQQIGNQFGITREAVRQRLQSALKRIRRKFTRELDAFILRGLEI